jgi:hypothetical protein
MRYAMVRAAVLRYLALSGSSHAKENYQDQRSAGVATEL